MATDFSKNIIKCLIVEDKPLSIDILKDYFEKVPFLELKGSFQNPLLALEYLYEHPVDLIFLDIQMPQLTGMQFLKLIRSRTKIIITSAYSQYALEGYEHEVIDYLLKPFSFERFYKAVEKYRGNIQENVDIKNGDNATSLFVKTEYKIRRIPFDSILYLEGKQNYVSIITTNEKIMTLQNLKYMEEILPSNQFIRVHKSYIIAVDKIDSIEKNQITIDRVIIPIGESYKTSLLNRIRY